VDKDAARTWRWRLHARRVERRWRLVGNNWRGRPIVRWWLLSERRVVGSLWGGDCSTGPGPIRCTANCSKNAQILQIKYAAIPKSKNVRTWHGGRVEHSEQLFSLCQLPNPNRIQVTNFGTNTPLNSSSNFKGIQTFLKNSNKFLKNSVLT
jgi:hypothetical protein